MLGNKVLRHYRPTEEPPEIQLPTRDFDDFRNKSTSAGLKTLAIAIANIPQELSLTTSHLYTESPVDAFSKVNRIQGFAMKQRILIVTLLGLLAALNYRLVAAEDPEKKGPFQADATKSGENTNANTAKPEFLFHVVDSNGQPVVGAKVSADWYSWRDIRIISATLTSDDVPPTVTDADGIAKVVFESDADHPPRPALQRLLKFGITCLGLKVDHPDHPSWSATIDPLANGVITLADSNRVEVRAHRENESAVAHHLYPCSQFLWMTGRRPQMDC